MNEAGYRFLGEVVWSGSKAYVRRRLRPPRAGHRTRLRTGLIAGAGLATAAALIARRSAR